MKKTVKSLLVIFFLAALASITLLSASAASGKLVHGDASGDGKVDIQDVLMLRKYLADYNYHTGNSSVEISTATDVTGDAKVNIHDLLMLRQYIANYNYDTNTSTVEFKHTVESAVAPTCTKWGATQGEFCSVCNIFFSQQEFLSPTGHNYVNQVCTKCGAAEIDYSDVTLYNSNEGYAFFETATNGEAMRSLYEEMEKVLTDFHTSAVDAPYFKFNEKSGDLYTVGVFDYSEYGLSYDEAKTVHAVFRKDHPAFYWMLGTIYRRGGEIIVTTIEEYAKGTDRSSYNKILYEGIEEYAKLVDGETSAYNIILTYYDEILKNNKYAYDDEGEPEKALWAHSVMGSFLYGEFVCEGYAKLFQLLLNFSGVGNMYVLGNVSSGAHAWNLAQMDDGKWYWFDLTWGDGRANPYRYFCVLDSSMTNHVPYPSGQLGFEFNAALPSRAQSIFDSDKILEIGEEFTVGTCRYVLSSAGTVKLISGSPQSADRLLYRGVVYNIAK